MLRILPYFWGENRFQEESPQNAPPQNLDNEDEFGQEEEVSGGISDLATEVIEDAERKRLLSVSGYSRCKKSVFLTL